MRGGTYLGYQRQGKTVSHNLIRQERKQKVTCSSEYCKKAVNRFCHLFEESERKDLFSTFWNGSWEEKKTYVINLVIQCLPHKCKHQITEISCRKLSFHGHLWHDGELLQVCKKMVLGTLELNEWMVLNWVKCSTRGMVKKNFTHQSGTSS